MCASCGYPAAPGHWTDAGATDPGDRIRARFRRARVLNAVLRAYGLTAHDGGLIPGIQIATLSGAQAIVDDLAGVMGRRGAPRWRAGRPARYALPRRWQRGVLTWPRRARAACG